MANCKGCDRDDLVWTEHEKTGKSAPLVRDPDGMFVIVAGKYRKATDEDDKLHRERYSNHFADCASASSFR